MAYLEFQNIIKNYEGEGQSTVRALDYVSFSIDEGDFVVFVGPSGCGKSTFLRMIAGLEEITDGTMILEGEKINDVEVKDRDISMVFQDYALYPHMTVKENLSFGLKNKKVDQAIINEKVNDVLEILELADYAERYPKQLSGGQRQRVALGRSIVKEPKVFLLDEPLSNLDARLRINTRQMILDLHKRLGTTMVYVTHDQVEAMTLGDKIVVMNAGQIQQIDSPENIYLEPQNTFVANFIGSPSMNLTSGYVNEQLNLLIGESIYETSDKAKGVIKPYQKKEVVVGVRPENVEVSPDVEDGKEVIQPKHTEFLGSENILYFDFYGSELLAKVHIPYKLSDESLYSINIQSEDIFIFDKETTQRIY